MDVQACVCGLVNMVISYEIQTEHNDDHLLAIHSDFST
jgi:hypothetical protein